MSLDIQRSGHWTLFFLITFQTTILFCQDIPPTSPTSSKLESYGKHQWVKDTVILLKMRPTALSCIPLHLETGKSARHLTGRQVASGAPDLRCTFSPPISSHSVVAPRQPWKQRRLLQMGNIAPSLTPCHATHKEISPSVLMAWVRKNTFVRLLFSGNYYKW